VNVFPAPANPKRPIFALAISGSAFVSNFILLLLSLYGIKRKARASHAATFTPQKIAQAASLIARLLAVILIEYFLVVSAQVSPDSFLALRYEQLEYFF